MIGTVSILLNIFPEIVPLVWTTTGYDDRLVFGNFCNLAEYLDTVIPGFGNVDFSV